MIDDCKIHRLRLEYINWAVHESCWPASCQSWVPQQPKVACELCLCPLDSDFVQDPVKGKKKKSRRSTNHADSEGMMTDPNNIATDIN